MQSLEHEAVAPRRPATAPRPIRPRIAAAQHLFGRPGPLRRRGEQADARRGKVALEGVGRGASAVTGHNRDLQGQAPLSRGARAWTGAGRQASARE